ncbi:hypothetical protein [Kitasatospora sp. NPDC101183]|uniref:hypothetical protein n=1 Tax=Kitasatospora sp. NPDC101183 TaxID=3364100 RepID=UPI003802D25C
MGDDQSLAPEAKGGPAEPTDPPTVHLRTADQSTVHLRIAGAAVAQRGANLPILTALALVLVAALIAIGVRLSSHPVLDPGLARDNHSLREPARLRALLPGISTFPNDLWQVESGPVTGVAGDGRPCLLPEATNGCTGQLSYATETFRSGGGRSLQFSVIAYDSPQTAGRAFATLRDHPGATIVPSREPSSGANAGASTAAVPHLGDESALVSFGMDGADGAEALLRMADLLIDVRSPNRSLSGPLLAAFALSIAQGVGQGQTGDHT